MSEYACHPPFQVKDLLFGSAMTKNKYYDFIKEVGYINSSLFKPAEYCL